MTKSVNKPTLKSNRRRFFEKIGLLITGVSAGSVPDISAAIPSKPVTMLSTDGKLVQINRTVYDETRKIPASHNQILNWFRKNKAQPLD